MPSKAYFASIWEKVLAQEPAEDDDQAGADPFWCRQAEESTEGQQPRQVEPSWWRGSLQESGPQQPSTRTGRATSVPERLGLPGSAPAAVSARQRLLLGPWVAKLHLLLVERLEVGRQMGRRWPIGGQIWGSVVPA